MQLYYSDILSSRKACAVARYLKSPVEFIELSSAHARKQFETFVEQGKHLTGVAQKVTTDAVEPLQAGVKNSLATAA